MKQQSQLFKRVVKPYFLLITVIISVATVVIYSSSIGNMKNDAAEAMQQLTERTARLTDTYISDLESLASQVRHQQKITSAFYELQDSEGETNAFEKDVINSIDISSTLKSLLAGRSADYNISIYNENGDFISSHNYLLKSNAPETLSRGAYERLIEEIHEKGGAVIEPPQQNRWTNGRKRYITYITELKNEYVDDGCGIIEVRASTDRLDELLSADGEISEAIVIRNRSNGEIIYPLGYNGEESRSYITAPLATADWEAAAAYSDLIPHGYRIQIICAFVILYGVLLAFVLVITTLIGRYVSKPIMELSEHVRAINTSGGKLEPVDGAFDEIKTLEDSFNSLLERMDESMQKEKRAYSLALQAQMNPHFLYNSLSVIGAAGMESGADNVYDMCIELSDMLRYVAAYEKVTVPLREEIIHTRNYLSLMKSRYEELFDYSVEVDEWLMNMPVPKLFIQPLAENCFKHGFKEKEPPWSIKIAMHGTRDRWELVISDNGSGITDERIAELEASINKALSEMSVGGIGGLGVVNTIVRLKMTHNSNIKYSIDNSSGMTIKIVSGGGV